MTVFAGHRVVRDRRLPSHNGRSLPSQCYVPARDVGVTRHQQEFPDSRPIPVLPLTCDRHGWDDGSWAFPWASHPTDQEPATHATAGTRSNTTRSYAFDIRRTSFTSSLTTCDFRVATTPTGRTEASPTPDPCDHCPIRLPSQQPSHAYASTDTTDSAGSSTNTSTPLDQHGCHSRHPQPQKHSPNNRAKPVVDTSGCPNQRFPFRPGHSVLDAANAAGSRPAAVVRRGRVRHVPGAGAVRRLRDRHRGECSPSMNWPPGAPGLPDSAHRGPGDQPVGLLERAPERPWRVGARSAILRGNARDFGEESRHDRPGRTDPRPADSQTGERA